HAPWFLETKKREANSCEPASEVWCSRPPAPFATQIGQDAHERSDAALETVEHVYNRSTSEKQKRFAACVGVIWVLKEWRGLWVIVGELVGMARNQPPNLSSPLYSLTSNPYLSPTLSGHSKRSPLTLCSFS